METHKDYLAYLETFPPYKERTPEQQALLESAYKKLSEVEQTLVERSRLEAFFIPENTESKNDQFHISPSGKYALHVSSYKTGPSSWSYSRGVVTSVATRVILADVKRNYHSFPFAWVEDHVVGDVFVCGEDYQGQTVVNLTTGQRVDKMSSGSDRGGGFCWADIQVSEDKQTLLVSGCIWACPYEYRAYRFVDPFGEGWPEIECDFEMYEKDSNTSCELVGDTLTWIKTERVFKATGEYEGDIDREYSKLYRVISKLEGKKDPSLASEIEAALAAKEAHSAKYPDEDEDADKWKAVPAKKIVAKFVDGKLCLETNWKSQRVLDQEQAQKEWNMKWTADTIRWKQECPIYTALLPKLTAEGLSSSFMVPSAHSRDNGENNPAYFTVSCQKYVVDQKRSSTLSWGVLEGEIKLECWLRGKGNVSTCMFKRNEVGIKQAWTEAKKYLETP